MRLLFRFAVWYHSQCLRTCRSKDIRGDARRFAAIRKKVVAIARKEYASTLAVRRLVTKDSRLGWEPRMKYYGGIEQIDWKLRRMEELYGDAVRRPTGQGEGLT